MNSTVPRTLPGRIADGIIRRLLRHVIWHASESRNLAGAPGDHLPIVIVLGREHYQERQKRYPALRTGDLRKVLREELADQPPTLTIPGPVRGDGRDVSLFRLDRAVIEALPRSLFIIPESVLLESRLAENDWADVERQGFRYFLFRNGVSQPAGGALGQRELVAMAAGVDPGRTPKTFHGSDELLLRLRQSLSSLPASTWWSCRNPLPRRFGLDAVAWRPVALTAALIAFSYLVFSSLYLQASLSLRSGDLDTLRPEIQEGLVANEEARELEARRNALAELWGGRVDTQVLWQGVALAVQKRASINQIEMRDGQVRFYGEAADAAEILTTLAAVPDFKDVTFDSAVRSGRSGRQNFTLSFALAEAAADSEQADE